jgi:hypothetical protein
MDNTVNNETPVDASAESPILDEKQETTESTVVGETSTESPVVGPAMTEEPEYPKLLKTGFDPLNRRVCLFEQEEGLLLTKEGFEDQFFNMEFADVAHSQFEFCLLDGMKQ